ncbi:MAG: ferredoxin [Desulfovibrionaceae bacterium CG1_02_65_16]|nr:MAG: ferredoxin [Desulfovibrionaceae bacterium CG1_02_65_16]
MGIADRLIEDVGLRRGVSRLTPEIIEKTVNAVISGETGARLKAYAETCMRCGLCAQACHFSLSHPGDPSYTPAGKVQQTMSVLLKTGGRVDPDFIYGMAQLAYTECNLCRRCVHYCPIGIDTGYIMSTVRRICHKLGVTPQYIQDTAHSHSATFNQMWVKDDEWTDTLMWQEDEARDEFPDIRIPLDKEGADIYYSVIAPEPKFRTQLIYQAAAIMHMAGVDWTMPSEPGWDNSDMCMFTGDFEMMGRLKRKHFESAQKLKVKRIVMGECGHAFRSIYDMGNRAVGWKMPPVPVIHSIEFFWELMQQGKIKLVKKYPGPVTVHDPCNVVRGRGLHEKLRELVNFLVEGGIVETASNREHNLCCTAGGGVINCGPPFKNVRVAGSKAKAEELRATGVKTIVAPCHNCHGGLEDTVHSYKLGMEIKFLGDIIYECMEKPEV